ncbi:UNVERIFIED_CONTAM: hypothetical protein PYX00_006715 [Menopon gallinae]|uniref:Polycystin cation channel PKD1/PKD2 domain-containing protein n=1 Tax=Menopon gallinae TaxID=328185 RepID=A0AAW2HWR7_9NEOP
MTTITSKEDCLINAALTANCEEEKLRRKLQFFFMNPIQKWQTKQRFPYKFLVQVVKIFLVTLQLYLFAHNRYIHVNYMWDNQVTFSHLFLLGWDPSREVSAYPPASGPLALYKKPEFYDAIDYAVKGYGMLDQAIGPYSYSPEDNSIGMQLCISRYKEGTIFGLNESYAFNNEIVTACTLLNFTRETSGNFSSKDYLSQQGVTVQFSALVEATLSFGVKTVNFKSAGPISPPDCYKFNISIYFDNRDHDGQMKLSLNADTFRLQCKGDTEYKTDGQLFTVLHSILNSLVIVICSLSLILCSRAIYRAQLLKFETVAFFRRAYKKDVSVEGRFEFLNFWYIMIIANDIMIIAGSSIKQQIEAKQFSGDEWNFCSVLLGTGNMLVWFGILRYLGFFKTYNVVILTLKKATPKLLRFLLCALLIYAGFTFCGWLVLGPYHMKFRSLATTSECLFALINGDDMFATFSTMDDSNSTLLWWYSRIYLYVFISLYIYVILSLFISVIIDAYETIKSYYKDGFPKNDIQEFVSDCYHNTSVPVRSESSSSLEDALEMCRRSGFKNALRKMCCGGTTREVPHQEIM